jgi:hypothetical protein
MQDLGYTVEVNTTIRGYHGEHNVDIAAKKSTGYGLGFVMNPAGTYDLVADWWGISGKGEKKIVEELKCQAEILQKEYARKIVLEQTAADGFDLVSETEENDGTVRIVVRRWR